MSYGGLECEKCGSKFGSAYGKKIYCFSCSQSIGAGNTFVGIMLLFALILCVCIGFGLG